MYEERSERTMPVKTAMNSAIGIESTPRRRICPRSRGDQVRTSARARAASRLRRPTCATKPSRAETRAATGGDTMGRYGGGRKGGRTGRRKGGKAGRREGGKAGRREYVRTEERSRSGVGWFFRLSSFPPFRLSAFPPFRLPMLRSSPAP